ncbi:hypothetical protein C4D60_Mb07t20150 [Musa balbisiana]|uniref:Uncharacterized protein n=1 Tax=Musa balbisiana TaxID=52838 RepID=A0A4S8JGV7_MUSBA|nr:hypothetical protein C4D60_Mb07t20150 [Musa balbisiana]
MKILEKQRQDLLIHQWIFSFCRDSNRYFAPPASLWKRLLVAVVSRYYLTGHDMHINSLALMISLRAHSDLLVFLPPLGHICPHYLLICPLLRLHPLHLRCGGLALLNLCFWPLLPLPLNLHPLIALPL